MMTWITVGLATGAFVIAFVLDTRFILAVARRMSKTFKTSTERIPPPAVQEAIAPISGLRRKAAYFSGLGLLAAFLTVALEVRHLQERQNLLGGAFFAAGNDASFRLLTKLDDIASYVALPDNCTCSGVTVTAVEESAYVSPDQRIETGATMTLAVPRTNSPRDKLTLCIEAGRFRDLRPATAEFEDTTSFKLVLSGSQGSVELKPRSIASSEEDYYYREVERLKELYLGRLHITISGKTVRRLRKDANEPLKLAVGYGIAGWTRDDPITFAFVAPRTFGMDSLSRWRSVIAFDEELVASRIRFVRGLALGQTLRFVEAPDDDGLVEFKVARDLGNRYLYILDAPRGLKAPVVMYFEQSKLSPGIRDRLFATYLGKLVPSAAATERR